MVELIRGRLTVHTLATCTLTGCAMSRSDYPSVCTLATYTVTGCAVSRSEYPSVCTLATCTLTGCAVSRSEYPSVCTAFSRPSTSLKMTIRSLLTCNTHTLIEYQCCGSGSKLDPYSGPLWNRIHTGKYGTGIA